MPPRGSSSALCAPTISMRNDATEVRWTKRKIPSLFVNTAKISFWRCPRTRKKRGGNTTKNDETQANVAHSCSFVREHTDFWCSRTKNVREHAKKWRGGFREHEFHWGDRSSRLTDRPTRVCASSRRSCEYHRPGILFVRFGPVAQPQAKHRGCFAH